MNDTQDTQVRWQKLRDIFDEVIQLKDEKRDVYLSNLRVNEKTLYQEVAELIEVESEARDFLSKPVSIDLESKTRVGETFGNYKIVKEIGFGGMGVVFEAVRDDGEFQQRVAIKLTNQSLFSDDLEKRFRNERQILATLEHPNIVNLLDGGITIDKIPFYVMEFVEGIPLNIYCRENNLGINQRLKLFLQICDAVAYAHRHFVVHRDLKPSNILVTKKGQVKLLDFGIAKVLETHSDFQTMTQNAPLTPGYSSPEQIRGKTISTSSDIFSLGIILYELLTEKAPTKIFGVEKLELPTAICEIEPPRPSQNSDDKSTLKSLTKQEKNDLDNITLKAMEKNSEKRYGSVEQFAEDIKSYLQGMPVKAHPQSVSYRASKLIRRNKLLSITIAMAVLFILTALSFAIWQFMVAQKEKKIAEDRFNQVRKIANSLIMEYHDEIAKLDGSTKLREKLVIDAVKYLDVVSAEQTQNPELLKEMAIAYRKIGNVQGQAYDANLGKLEEALKNYAKSVSLLEKGIKIVPTDKSIKIELIESYKVLGFAYLRTGDNKKARSLVMKGVEIARTLVSEYPNDVNHKISLARLKVTLGDLVEDDFTERLEYYNDSLSNFQTLYKDNPNNKNIIRNLYSLEGRIGNTIEWMGDRERKNENIEKSKALYLLALEHHKESFKLKLKYESLRTDGFPEKRGLFVSHANLVKILAKVGRTDEALLHFEKADKLIKEMLKKNKNSQEYILDEITHLNNSQLIYKNQKRFDLALNEIDKGIKLAKAHYEKDTMNAESMGWIGHLSEEAIEILNKQGNDTKTREYKQIYQKYRKIFYKKFGKEWKLNF